jgi:urease accessory protein
MPRRLTVTTRTIIMVTIITSTNTMIIAMGATRATPITTIITTITTTTSTTTGTATTTTIIGMTTPKTEREVFAELPLLLWLSPAFPVGAFAYSHGLEWAVEAGDVADAATLRDWLDDLLSFGAPRNDAVLFALAFRAAAARDKDEVVRLNELAVALAGSAERRLETNAQGGAFLAAMRGSWMNPVFDLISAESAEPVAYPIAVALAAAGHQLPLESSLQAFVLSLVANLVSAAVRLGPIGQSDGQRVLAGLLQGVRRVAAAAASAGLDDLGGCALRSDIAAMRHETQYSRLFRS